MVKKAIIFAKILHMSKKSSTFAPDFGKSFNEVVFQ